MGIKNYCANFYEKKTNKKKELMKLDFLVIGAQKASTSSLYSYLQQEDGIQMSIQKELHLFDNEEINWLNPSYELYHSKFPINDSRLKGEITPFYMYESKCIDRIYKYNPKIKLIMLLRNPIERAFSQYKMSVHINKVEILDFSLAIREGRQRISKNNRVFSYVERGFYGKQLSYIYSKFPKEQVLVLESTKLNKFPQETIQLIRNFLLINDKSSIKAIFHENKTRDPKLELKREDIDYLKQIYKEDDIILKSLCGISFQ